MREIIRKVIQETKTSKFIQRLKDMGPKKAKDSLGLDLDDFVRIAYDDDIIQYVSEFMYPLTRLEPSGNNAYDYNGEGPLSGLVFKYIGRHKTGLGNIVPPTAYIPEKKLNYLINMNGILTEKLFLEFLNEYYELNVTRIVPIRPTNYG